MNINSKLFFILTIFNLASQVSPMWCILVLLMLDLVLPQLYPPPAFVQNFAGKRATQGIVAPGSSRSFVPLQSNTNRSSLPSQPLAVGFTIYTIPDNAPSSAAVSISLAGSSFGAQDFSARLRLGITASETTVWISLSSLACKSGAGSSKTESIVVTILSRLISDPVSGSASYDSGWISVIPKKNAPSTGSSSVTLHGSNMGLLSYSFTSRPEHTASEVTKWVSDTAISSQTSHGIRGSRRLAVTIGSKCGSVSNSFSFSAPKLRGYSQDLDVQFCSEGAQTAVLAPHRVYGCKGVNVSSLPCSNGYKICSGSVEISHLSLNFSVQSFEPALATFYEARTCSSTSKIIPTVRMSTFLMEQLFAF